MKHVVKNNSPVMFESWKLQVHDDWTPAYADLRNPEKAALHKALLAEQGWVCCYCGREVTTTDSHIEHFFPQRFDELSLAYENLYASCIREQEPGLPLHCGHAKADRFDEALQISPRDATCEERFLYTLRGEILPSDPIDSNAVYMKDLLQLGNSFLNNRREEALANVFDPAFLETVTPIELGKLRDAFRACDASGHLQSYGHVLARYAEQCISTFA